MGIKKKLGFLAILSIVLAVLYVGIGLNANNWQYALSRRLPSMLAVVLTGGCIAFSTTIFQTVTNNRILTPSVLGLDALYMFIQTTVVFVLGSTGNTFVNNSNVNFVLSLGFMTGFSLILFKLLFKKETNNIYFLLLVGLIFGTLFQSLSSFMQMLIDPNEFTIIQGRMFASFNNVNKDILAMSIAVIFLVVALTYKQMKLLDVMSLGKEQAINLGVNYDKVAKKMLIAVAVLVSVSTALVGPITFLGLLVANLAREFLGTFKHKYLIWGAVLISLVALLGGQFIVSRLINFNTTLSVIINFVGGLYFIYLLLKENKA
jgi:iron complex transport system permease protein